MTERLCNLKKNRPTILSHFLETKFHCDFQQKLLASALEQLEKNAIGSF